MDQVPLRRKERLLRPVGEWAPSRCDVEAAMKARQLSRNIPHTTTSHGASLPGPSSRHMINNTNRVLPSIEIGREGGVSRKRKQPPVKSVLQNGCSPQMPRCRKICQGFITTKQQNLVPIDLTRSSSPPTPTPKTSSPSVPLPVVSHKSPQKRQSRQRNLSQLTKQTDPTPFNSLVSGRCNKGASSSTTRLTTGPPLRSRHNHQRCPKSSGAIRSNIVSESQDDARLPFSKTQQFSTPTKTPSGPTSIKNSQTNQPNVVEMEDTPKTRTMPVSTHASHRLQTFSPQVLGHAFDFCTPRASFSGSTTCAVLPITPCQKAASDMLPLAPSPAVSNLSTSLDSSPSDAYIETLLTGKIKMPSLTSTPVSKPASTPHRESCESQLSIVDNVQPLPPEAPRFLQGDLQLLPSYFCKPVSIAYTTCSSIILPPAIVPGFPLDHYETLLRDDQWRIRKEVLGEGRAKLECWVQGTGWPVKTLCILGWLVGIDRREYWITYHIDDGTAVLECQIPIRQLRDIHSCQNSALKLIHGSECDDVNGPAEDNITTTTIPDPKLAAYRRPLFQKKKSGGHMNPSLSHISDIHSVEVEALVEIYSNLTVGTALCISGTPRELFRSTKRVMEVESLSIITSSREELDFRKHVIKSRRGVYNRPFRLAEVWPNRPVESHPDVGPSTSIDPRAPPMVSTEEGARAEARLMHDDRLRLRKVQAIRLDNATFPLFLTYAAHHITKTYAQSRAQDANPRHPLPLQGPQPGFTISDLLDNSDLKSLATKVVHKKEFDQWSACQKSKYSEAAFSTNRLGVCVKSKTKLLMNVQHASMAIDDESLRSHDPKTSTVTTSDAMVPFTSQLTSEELKVRIRTYFSKAIHRLIVKGIVIISPEYDDQFTIPDVHNLGCFIRNVLVDAQASSGITEALKLDTIMSRLRRDDMWKWIPEDKVSDVLKELVNRGEVCKMFDGSNWRWTSKHSFS